MNCMSNLVHPCTLVWMRISQLKQSRMRMWMLMRTLNMQIRMSNICGRSAYANTDIRLIINIDQFFDEMVISQTIFKFSDIKKICDRHFCTYKFSKDLIIYYRGWGLNLFHDEIRFVYHFPKFWCNRVSYLLWHLACIPWFPVRHMFHQR